MNCYRVTFRDGYAMLVDAESEQEARDFAHDSEGRAQPHNSAVRCQAGANGTKIKSVKLLD